MVHGNHEGFTHLERLVPPHFPSEPIPLSELPGVDARQRLRLLPSGWRAVTPSGHLVASVGGIEQGQRQARYHPMAYLDDDAVAHLLQQGQVHLLLTHQGPSAVQGDHGSPTLQLLLDEGIASAWCHGHSTPNPQPVQAGPAGKTQVVPLGDIAFPVRGPHKDEAGPDGWALATLGRSMVFVEKKTPPFLLGVPPHKMGLYRRGLAHRPAPGVARLVFFAMIGVPSGPVASSRRQVGRRFVKSTES
jgi:hypothetical protein